MTQLLSVHLHPGSKQNKIILKDKNTYEIYVSAIAAGNKANEMMINILSKHLHVAKTCINIRRGHQSRHKMIEIL